METRVSPKYFVNGCRWKEIVSRFKGKLLEMIKDVNDRFEDYSISPKIRQILLHLGYELVENDLLFFCFFVHIKMRYYWFNRQELLQKVKEKYHDYGGKKKLLNIALKTGKF